MHRIPGNPLDSSDGGLVQTLDTEGGDFVKRGAAELESIISCPGCRGERLRTNLALVAATLASSSLVEAMVNNGSGVGFARWRAVPVWTAETLHGSWTSSTLELMAWN